MIRRDLEIARWLATSNIDLNSASLITGIPAKRLSAIRNRVERNSYRIFLPPELEIAISAMAGRGKLTFVQVGANDGKTGDPIFNSVIAHGARALLIEPQPWLIDEIKKNYSEFSGELVLENIAVGPGGGKLSIYILKKSYWDEYISRVGRHPSAIFSPDQEQVLGRIAQRLRLTRDEAMQRIEALEVPVHPLSAIIARNGFDNPDVVQIDCEGWDVRVIESLGTVRPALINFESCNLSAEDWLAFQKWSELNGYGYIRGHFDTLAIRDFTHRVEQ